jgi:hypothetical protein
MKRRRVKPGGALYRFLRVLPYFDLMVETRIAPRYRVSKAGTIEFVGGKPINCVVRDLSVTGAAIEVSNQAGIPDKFLLVMPDDGLRLACRVAWRKEYRIGVAFD